MRPACRPRRWQPAFAASPRRRCRAPGTARGAITRWPAGLPSPASSIRCRKQPAWGFISPWIWVARHASVPTPSGWRSPTTWMSIRPAPPASLPLGALLPGYAGMRPKLAPPESVASDFLIQGPAAHGIPGLVNLYGIESPGLTASLALADMVVEAAEDAS